MYDRSIGESGVETWMRSNRLVWAALVGSLVWFADQPTIEGYDPLLEMFWDPGFWKASSWDRVVLLLFKSSPN